MNRWELFADESDQRFNRILGMVSAVLMVLAIAVTIIQIAADGDYFLG